MDNFLLDLPVFAVGADGLVVSAVLVSIPLNLDRPYIDADFRL